jgi:hypothetical protein
MMSPILAVAGTGAANGIAGFLVLVFLAVVVAGTVWFFVGPAKHADDYVKMLQSQIGNVDDRVLFMQMYQVKHPKNVIVAWVLTTFLSPTIAYAYRNKWGFAALAFFTFQGFGVWWLVSIFTTPFEVMNQNKQFAEAAFTELKLARPNALHHAEPIPVQSYFPAMPSVSRELREEI